MQLLGGSAEAPESFLEKQLIRPQTPGSRRIHSSVPRSDEICMILQFAGESVEMPCKHAISPDALMDYCWNEVSNGKKCQIRCCLCDGEWPIEVIKRFGGATEEELRMLEEGLTKNYCNAHSDIRECPGCMSLCERKNKSNLCVQCLICTRKNEKSYHFCWNCCQTWLTALTATQCGNTSCSANTEVIDQLLTAPEKNINGVMAPSIRACPSCNSLIEHKSDCKQMTCRVCNGEFCFICLRKRSPDGTWMCGSYNDRCIVAPRQTVLSKTV